MQPRGLLMKEHRIIERMISLLNKAVTLIGRDRRIDPVFVDMAVDFIRTYADRTHHGKEEDILFRELERRRLSVDDYRIMKELFEEHAFGRQTTKALVEANARYRAGDESALDVIAEKIKTLIEFYPRHIEKEDTIFLPSSRIYLSKEEEQAMVAEFIEFDAKMIHEKYASIAEKMKL